MTNAASRLAALAANTSAGSPVTATIRTVQTVNTDTVDVDAGDGTLIPVACGSSYRERAVGDIVVILIIDGVGWLAISTTKAAGYTPA